MIFTMSELLDRQNRTAARREPDADALAMMCKSIAHGMQMAGYLRSDKNADSYDALVRYFSRYSMSLKGDCDPPSGGLFLYGTTGTGKTSAMEIFSAMFLVEFLSIHEIGQRFVRYSPDSFWGSFEALQKQPLIIDDIGNEGLVRSFGQPIPISVIINMRADSFKRFGTLTFFTSNSDSSAPLAEMYGEATRSRILGMVEKGGFLRFDGKDKRF